MSTASNPENRSTVKPRAKAARFSFGVTVSELAIPGALALCLIVLLALLLALTSFTSASTLSSSSSFPSAAVSLISSDNQGVSMVIHSAPDLSRSSAKNFLIAVPPGAEASLVEARSFGSASAVPVVTLGAISTVRGWRVAALSIVVAEAVVYDSLQITIAFSPSSVVPSVSKMAEPGFFEKIFQATMINYAQAQNWKNESSRLARLTSAQTTPTAFDFSSDWVKLVVRDNGLVRVNADQLIAAQLMTSGRNSSLLRVFYAGGEVLSPRNDFSRPDFSEIPLIMFDGADGSFDSGDYFYFYGESSSRWLYEAGKAPRFLRNVYTDDNIYWVSATSGFPSGALRMAQVDGSPSGSLGAPLTTTRQNLRFESDQILSRDGGGEPNDYYNWYWNQGTTHTISAGTFGAVTSGTNDDTTRYLAHIIARTAQLRVDGALASSVSNPSQHYWSFKTPAVFDAIHSFDFSLSEFFSRGPYFDYLEIDYPAQLILSQSELSWGASQANGRREFALTNAVPSLLTLDISDPRNPLLITGGSLQSGEWKFEANLTAGGVNRFYVATPAAIKAPFSMELVTSVNLRADTLSQVDYLIVTPAGWQNALGRYVDHRQSYSNISARIVTVESIYDEFGFGSPDPSSIRDFLKYTYEHYLSPVPSTVLLVGDGVYDFRNVTNRAPSNIIPPYTSPFDNGFASDDHYVYFDDFAFLDSDNNSIPDSVYGVDMTPARWPVRTFAELNTVIDKTIAYEATPEFGSWKSRVTLLADDEFGEFVNESVHVRQTEELEKQHLPPGFIRDKIYLWDFLLNSLRERPAVNDALVRSVNEGSLILNYVGHGNPALFAHERVFTSASDLPRLTNGARLPLVFTASCSIGFFDSPEREGMAEELLRMNNGAIAIVSATRLVYSSANALFNRVAYDHLFGPLKLTMAQAVFAAKLTRQTGSGTVQNDRRYSFFGDPYLRLAVPENEVSFTSIPDSLVALQPVLISGSMLNQSGVVMSNFNGLAEVTVYDTRITRNHKVLNNDGDVSDDVSYNVNGPIIFRGSTPVVNGEFTLTFVPSLDIGFGGDGARVAVYASSETTDAYGTVDSLRVGSVVTATNDTEGPEIVLEIPERSEFISGDQLSSDEMMVIKFSDTSGVNLSGGFGHGITLTVDGDVTSQVDLTSGFVYEQGSYLRGQVSWKMENVEPGDRSFKVKAWDNANNSSTLEFSAEVTSDAPLAIHDLLNYPNPMTERTSFYFTLQAAASRMTIQVFTLSGIKIFERSAERLAPGYHEEVFEWDGRDLDGDRVATGVYLYKATAYPSGNGELAEQFGKLIVMN